MKLNIVCHSDEIMTTPFLHLRYLGTNCALMCFAEAGCVAGYQSDDEGGGTVSGGARCKYGDFQAAFINRYEYLLLPPIISIIHVYTSFPMGWVWLKLPLNFIFVASGTSESLGSPCHLETSLWTTSE